MSTSAGLSPADITYQLRHATDDRHTEVVVVAAVFMILTPIAVVLRVLSRKLSGQKLKADDWCIVAALMVQLAGCIMQIIATKHGFGRHIILLGVVGIPKFLKFEYAFQILYACGIALTKFSLLLFYRRVFQPSRILLAVNAMAVYVALWCIAGVLTVALQCSPPSHYWNRFSPGTCIKPLIAFEMFSALNILSDVLLLILPLPVIWNLQVVRSQKIAISSVFLVGGFVCIASVVRAPYLRPVGDDQDPSYTAVNGGIWSLIELSVGVICANLAIMRPVLKRYIIKPIATLRGTRNSSTGNTGNLENNIPVLPSRRIASKSQSSTRFSSQASTQVQTQNQSEDKFKQEEVERPTNKGWRAFLPHKESRFVGDTTWGSAMDQTRPGTENDNPSILMGEIREKQDIESGSPTGLLPRTQQMQPVPQPAASTIPSEQ